MRQRDQRRALPVAAGALCVSAGLDRLPCCYGAWTLVQLNFVRFNLLDGGSALFGAHPWHWYLSQGAPAVLGTFLPAALGGAALSLATTCRAMALYRSTQL